jgi:hypothetical protein
MGFRVSRYFGASGAGAGAGSAGFGASGAGAGAAGAGAASGFGASGIGAGAAGAVSTDAGGAGASAGLLSHALSAKAPAAAVRTNKGLSFMFWIGFEVKSHQIRGPGGRAIQHTQRGLASTFAKNTTRYPSPD